MRFQISFGSHIGLAWTKPRCGILTICPMETMARYVIERDGWTFDYTKEGLWNFPTLSNQRIREAVALAKELSVPFYLDHNKGMFFDE